MAAKTLMLQGAGSSVGKSLLSAALCRIYARRGVRVAPFKAQNMSNNAAVCADGGEIGRAQALQAAAAGLPPATDMNPVLIKPEADARSQIVRMGRPWRTLAAKEYYREKLILWETVRAALDRLRESFELVVIEGAGSPAELNLREGDIVNMAVARYARSPVLLAGDIDRGGIFAQLLGTLWLLEPEDRALVKGLLVNKFRGDRSLFDGGVRVLEERGGIPVLGVVPFLPALSLPEEDAVAVETDRGGSPGGAECVEIALIAFPRIANFDEFDPLRAEAGVRLRYVKTAAEFGNPRAVILPGTKSTIADLAWMRRSGLAEAVVRFAANGGAVAGICGGYQMLGRIIRDPAHMESSAEEAAGLGLLPAETVFTGGKATFQSRAQAASGPGWLQSVAGERLGGYEIHSGETAAAEGVWLTITERNGAAVRIPAGAADPQGRIWGCSPHGLFGNPRFRRGWLRSLGWRGAGSALSANVEQGLEALADAVEDALDMERLEKILWES
ncbi:MAG: cobyric acid synthase [Anaerolineales bacterium]|nr:cobyric acid synthase [Anaerolineales bacterium]